MIDLSAIEQAKLLARGSYATVNSAHKDELKRLQVLCGQLMSFSTMILNQMQPKDGVPDIPERLIVDARTALINIEKCCGNIESLARQKEGLRGEAWK